MNADVEFTFLELKKAAEAIGKRTLVFGHYQFAIYPKEISLYTINPIGQTHESSIMFLNHMAVVYSVSRNRPGNSCEFSYDDTLNLEAYNNIIEWADANVEGYVAGKANAEAHERKLNGLEQFSRPEDEIPDSTDPVHFDADPLRQCFGELLSLAGDKFDVSQLSHSRQDGTAKCCKPETAEQAFDHLSMLDDHDWQNLGEFCKVVSVVWDMVKANYESTVPKF